jgi:hypothetical protein
MLELCLATKSRASVYALETLSARSTVSFARCKTSKLRVGAKRKFTTHGSGPWTFTTQTVSAGRGEAKALSVVPVANAVSQLSSVRSTEKSLPDQPTSSRATRSHTESRRGARLTSIGVRFQRAFSSVQDCIDRGLVESEDVAKPKPDHSFSG